MHSVWSGHTMCTGINCPESSYCVLYETCLNQPHNASVHYIFAQFGVAPAKKQLTNRLTVTRDALNQNEPFTTHMFIKDHCFHVVIPPFQL